MNFKNSQTNNKSGKIFNKSWFQNVKSKYVIKMIFELLTEKNKLNVIKYNKNLKDNLDIAIKDYKLFTNIEIEITLPKKDNFLYDYDNKKFSFINISKEYAPYIHIFLKNDKKELKGNIIPKVKKIDKIKIVLDNEVKSLKDLFKESPIESLTFTKFNNLTITDMTSLFESCQNLLKIDFTNFCSRNVTNMSFMFHQCSSLKKLNLSNFNTTNVKSMYFMFAGCSSLKKLDLSSFNTENVEDMCDLFHDCKSLRNLNISKFNTKNVIFMSGMFSNCKSLTKLDLSNFDTSKTTSMNSMFYFCKNLRELNITSFNTKNVTGMNNMFFGCSNLDELNLTNFYLDDNIISTVFMFAACSDKLIADVKRQIKNIKEETIDKEVYRPEKYKKVFETTMKEKEKQKNNEKKDESKEKEKKRKKNIYVARGVIEEEEAELEVEEEESEKEDIMVNINFG